MVKNKKGGRHKHMARKHVNASNNFRSRKLRVPKENGEILARIVKIEGGSNFEVLCNDNKNRLLVVRKKFKGRNKRDNILKIDTMVMVGLRDWQVLTGNKREKVDLLEVYNTHQLSELKKVKNINLDIFPAGEQSIKDEDNPFEIVNCSNELLDEEAIEKINKNIEKQKEEEEKQKEEEFDEIDWDDI